MLAALVLLAAVPTLTLAPAKKGKNEALVLEFTFTDKAGAHLLRFDRSAIKEKNKDDFTERSQRLDVTHLVKGKEVWKAKDFVERCEFDLALELIDGSVTLSDVDEDGETEVAFAYRLGCRSDVSPNTAKLLLYEGKTKYALRGETREQVGEKEFQGGTFKADPAFDAAPAFLTHAKALWHRHILGAAAP